ncbi:MAG: phosphatidylcholine/phosphatidylserine synthase [Treponema sp.]|nr:phosphatidylcholine/phosphatidylserine synthase [Treponema sp.]
MKIQPLGKGKTKVSKLLQKAGRKKRRLKYIAVLPSFITLMNGACGFIAIVFASRSLGPDWAFLFSRGSNMTSFALAGYMICLAMAADVLDGRVARLTRTTSSFGGQLDSLCDAVSFGVAPAFLMVKLVEYHLEHLHYVDRSFSIPIERVVFFSAIIYAMCAVVRLARFNVENEEDATAHMHFAGLPSPAAAGVVVSLIIFHQQLLPWVASRSQESHQTLEVITVFAFPVITLLTGVLMVSRIRYPHLANQLLRSKKTLPSLLAIFATGIIVVWNIQFALFIGFCSFALYGLIRWFLTGILKKPRSGS